MIVTAQIIANLPSRAVIIDLASKPGGTDFRFAEKRGIKALFAPGLPGIVAPRTAGRIIADCLSRLIMEDSRTGEWAMKWQGKTVGFALSGSHCTFAEVMPVIQRFVDEGANVIPIVTQTIMMTDTRFGSSEHWQRELEQ